MFSSIGSYSIDQLLVTALIGFGIMASVFLGLKPLIERRGIRNRIKSINDERSRMKVKRDRDLEQASSKRMVTKAFVKEFIDRFNLKSSLFNQDTNQKLAMAGLRGPEPVYIYVAARVAFPGLFFCFASFYVFLVLNLESPFMVKLGMCLLAGAIGFYAPDIFLKNKITKRQTNIKKTWPDALDLLLICVESGMSIEVAMKRVAIEVSTQSIDLFEELSLMVAEISFLNDRRQAYENLAWRTGLETVRAVTTGLIQADKYGTSVGEMLRVLSAEARGMRMIEAEKKAAGLPPKLTVPMIVFFLPVLFAVIMGPAIIKITAS